jgi:hypothetical protein
MTSRHARQKFNKHIMAFAAFCCAFAVLSFVFPLQALAHERIHSPLLHVKAGFDSYYRDGNWVPVQVTLSNEGPDFNGTLSLLTPISQFQGGSSQTLASNYQVSITLANGAQKQVTLYLPLYFDVQHVTVKLLDSEGRLVGSQTAALTPLMTGDAFIGILSDQSTGFSSLSSIPLPNKGAIVLQFLNANSLPSMASALKNFNMIVLDNFTTNNLSAIQLSALQSWIDQGGSLILVGGPEWHRTFVTLPAGLVPVQIYGTKTISAGTDLLPIGGPSGLHPGQNNKPLTVTSPVSISAATLKSNVNADKREIILASHATPLIVQVNKEQGKIIYLAFDPALEPILGWQGVSLLWDSLLLRSMNDQLLPHSNISPGSGSSTQQTQPILANRMSGFLQSLLPQTIPPPWRTLGILLFCYIIVLGPVRFLLVKRLKGRYWSWRVILSSIVIFSLLSYGLANFEKGSSILSDSITLAQLNQNGSSAHLTTYMGVFVPNEGDYQVHISGNGQAQPSPDNFSFSQNGSASPITGAHTSVIPLQNETNVHLQDVHIWSFHTILAQQDRQIHKSFVSHLAIQNGNLVGTITNAFSYALNDAFLLMSNGVLSLGHLAAGETKHVQLKLRSIPLDSNSTLADLIAVNTNSPTYDALPPQPQSTWQRHLAILYALDGEGLFNFTPFCTGLCNGMANPQVPILPVPPGVNIPSFSSGSTFVNSVGITATPGWQYTGEREIDPLLVPGSPATLIGWAENSLDLSNNVTVNNINPSGMHETLIQAPLGVNLTGSLDLPPNFISGQLIDVASNNVQNRFPGVYTISTGSMTFEYLIPQTFNVHANALTISEPPEANFLAQAGSVSTANSSLFRLYNWHTNSWDSITLQQNTFTTNNIHTYISTAGRVLVQFSNKDSQLGSIEFDKPSINLQGVTSGQFSRNG